MSERSLRELASLYGISIEPRAKKSGRAGAVDKDLVSILKAVGLPITETADAGHLLQQAREHQCQQMLDPVLVLEQTEGTLSIPVRVRENDKQEYQWTLTEESATQHRGGFKSIDPVVASRPRVNNQRYTVKNIDLGVPVPCGYHRMVIHAAEHPDDEPLASLLLIITPKHCYVPPGIKDKSRVWGISVNPHALRSRNNWGIGDFSDLKRILSWSAEQGAGTLHTSPLHALLLTPRNVPNPYSPSSRSQLNILFIDVAAVPDFVESDEAGNSFHDTRFQARLAMLPDQDEIDYDAVHQTKEEILKKLWKHFSTNHLNPETARGADFRRFQQLGGDTLRYYGIFAAISDEFLSDDQHAAGWTSWPPNLRDPHGDAVAEFATHHQDEIEYHQYLQWQADIQLASIGRRSMELGLKVGLLGDMPFTACLNSFETWYYGQIFWEGMLVAANPSADPVIDHAVGLPLYRPDTLRNSLFRPFIEGLRHTMRHSGGIIIRSMPNYFRVPFALAEREMNVNAFLQYPFTDLLGIVALESQRNHCLVIADHIHQLPEEQQLVVRQKMIFSGKVLFQAKDNEGNWLKAADYPQNTAATSSAPFLASMKGFWMGRDIAMKTAENIFRDDAAREKAILSRASDRAHFLINLDHEKLLPEGITVDPASVTEMDLALITAAQIFLARSPAKLLLVSMNDLLVMEDQAVPPVMTDQRFWKTRFPVDLDRIIAGQDILAVFPPLCRERGGGVVRPSAPASDRKKQQGLRIPSSFYRLQLNKDFSFRQAAEIIPYLKGLGISHCYVSPLLTARPGSPHGYDIINHAAINPEIGSREDFEMFIAVLEQHQMALLLDIVPNHMGIGSDNQWWMDVLENGELSLYAHFFDINWLPQQTHLVGRVLLPVLGDHYGKILESGELELHFDENSGSFAIQYHDHRFPVAPRSYPTILNHDLTRLSDRLGKQHNGFLELQSLIASFDNLPSRKKKSEETIQANHRDKEVNKRLLARLCRELPDIKQFIEENVILFNGESGKPESYDLLHELLEQQAYRLAFWRVAADEINYRRFFDINDLAGLRMEDEQVFHETHKFILDLITTGKVDGLRIDHPDGLYDPRQYFFRLQASVTGDPLNNVSAYETDLPSKEKVPLYVVAEKVLADFEHLPETWPVNGTTGYDFANLLNGLLLDDSAEKPLTSLYHQFIGTRFNFDELLYNSKKLIIRTSMAGELNVLTSWLYRLAQANRSTRDFTFNLLRAGLTEIIACFPVYRTYISLGTVHKRDVHFIEWAVAKAGTKTQLDVLSVFDFIKSVLLLEYTENENDRPKHLDFVLKFQQYTGPVMAKGMEDTAFYIYNRLLSLNEVGGDPRRFGLSVAAFHRTNQDRLYHWPHSMLNSSTHDSKRSEDVRARINVLTEMAPAWKSRVSRWSRLNRPLKTQIEGMPAPSKNDEYAFYQNLLGAWPIAPLDEEGRCEFIDRVKNLMLKTCREAKEQTSWISANKPYEQALTRFIEGALAESNRSFLADFIPFQQDVSWFGMLNSLSQVFLKLVSPGIPDIYQGNEIWRFCLVDPDNRRPVDFQKRQAMLFPLLDRMNAETAESKTIQQELLANLTDGRAKMYVTAQTLHLRNSWPEVFEGGSYIPLEITGNKSRHICAFARKNGERMIIAVAPRLYVSLLEGAKQFPVGKAVWHDTVVKLPDEIVGSRLRNIYSDGLETHGGEDNGLEVGRLLQSWPVALLKGNVRQ